MAWILDVETVADPRAAEWAEPVAAPANYKDPVKIAAYIADATREQVERAALYPWTASVVCLGLCASDAAGQPMTIVCRTPTDEADALRWLWSRVVDGGAVMPLVGFKSRTYDLPVLLARSMVLGVPAPAINLDRYRSPHIDLLERLTWQGAIPARSLKWFARRFGIPVEDETSGADVARLVADGQYEAVADHCRSDLRITRALAHVIGAIR